jgi:hypothetical protein
MEKNRMKPIISVLLMVIFLAACSAPSQPSPTETQVIETQTPPATPTEIATEPAATSEGGVTSAAEEGLCANAYYPVREGSTWSYTSTGSPAGAYGFTDTITSVREDGFTLTSQFDKLTRTQEWSCKPEGLVALQLGGAALSSQNMKMDVKTQNISGITYPKEINEGDQWDYALDFTGKLELAGNSAEAQGSDKNHFNTLGVESVTVPAGTFDALKIQIDTTLDINASFQGVSVPVTFSGSYTYWFVQDVGWVKASGTGSIEGKSFNETIELQSYNLP